MGLYWGGLIIGRMFTAEIWRGAILGRAYFGGGGGGGRLLPEFYSTLSSSLKPSFSKYYLRFSSKLNTSANLR